MPGIRRGATVHLIAATALASTIWSTPGQALPRTYVANLGADTVSVIESDSVIATIAVGDDPDGIAAAPDGSRVYVANFLTGSVSVIDTATNAVVATITVGTRPVGIATAPNGHTAYVANRGSNDVSVIDTATNTVTATIAVGDGPNAVAVTPDGRFVYVTNSFSRYPGTVSVIDTATGTVVATIVVQRTPNRVAVDPLGRYVYVTNFRSGNVAVIDIATQKVVDYIPLFGRPSGIAVHPNGSLLYVSLLGGGVAVIDAGFREWSSTITVGNEPYGVASTRVGDSAYVANFASGTVSRVDLVNQIETAAIATAERPFALTVVCLGNDCDAPPFTPLPTRTPPPTRTPTATAPPTFTHPPIQNDFACSGGSRDGLACDSDDACFVSCSDFGACVLVQGVCDGGQFDAFPCDCPGGTCVGPDGSSSGACQGGPFAGDNCTVAGGEGSCGSGGQCVATQRICDNGALRAFGCLSAAQCNGASCVSTGRFCDGGDFSDYSCVVSDDCNAGGGPGTCRLSTSACAPTATPLATATGQPTATPSPERVAELRVGSVSGNRGGRTSIGVVLSSSGLRISGTQNDLRFDSDTPIAVRARNRPDCTVNSAIDKAASSFSFQPPGCQPGVDCTGIRALVLSLDNTAPIADGAELYRCNIAIAANAAVGAHAISVEGAIASDPAGERVPFVGVDGAVSVGVGNPQLGIEGSASSGSGCSTTQAADPAWWLTVPALWFVYRRRGAR